MAVGSRVSQAGPEHHPLSARPAGRCHRVPLRRRRHADPGRWGGQPALPVRRPRNRLEEQCFGKNDKPATSSDGYVLRRSRYDARDNEIEQAVFDADERPVMHKEGYASLHWKHDDHDRRIEADLAEHRRQALRQNDSAAILRQTYDDRGRLAEVRFFDENDRPTPVKNGCATLRLKYDERGNRIEHAFFDVEGQPTCTQRRLRPPAAEIRRSRQPHRAVLPGRNGLPVADENGYATPMRWQLNEFGDVIGEAYFGLDGKPVAGRGYASLRKGYDARGRPTQRSLRRRRSSGADQRGSCQRALALRRSRQRRAAGLLRRQRPAHPRQGTATPWCS